MNLGIDFHDTFTYNPKFFISLLRSWKGKKYIVTGTPKKDENLILQKLKEFDVLNQLDGVLMGFDFDSTTLTNEHFKKMSAHKLKMLQTHNIEIYYDDNPFYVSFLSNYGITVFQTILSQKYIYDYSLKNSYFSCHLQKEQFSFLKDYK